MNTKPLPDEVLVVDLGVDACVLEREGHESVLVIRPHQTFGSAVSAVSEAFPCAGIDQVRRLVRRYLPDAVDLDDILHEGQEDWRPTPLRYPYVTGLIAAVIALIAFALIVIEAVHEYRTDLRGQVSGLGQSVSRLL